MRTDSEILRCQQRRPTFRTVPSNDWRALLRTRANLLVNGPTSALTAFAQMAQSEMREPIRSVCPPLPAFLGEVRTLIITDVAGLDRVDQRRLIAWLDERRNAGLQVVALASPPLFSLVSTNRFDTQLYYRLNTISLEIEAA